MLILAGTGLRMSVLTARCCVASASFLLLPHERIFLPPHELMKTCYIFLLLLGAPALACGGASCSFLCCLCLSIAAYQLSLTIMHRYFLCMLTVSYFDVLNKHNLDVNTRTCAHCNHVFQNMQRRVKTLLQPSPRVLAILCA